MDLIWIWRWKPIASCVVSKSGKLNRNWKKQTLTALLAWDCSPGWGEQLTSQKFNGGNPRNERSIEELYNLMHTFPIDQEYIQGMAETAWKKVKVRQTWKLTALNAFLNLHTDSSIEDRTYKLKVCEHNLGSIVQTQWQDLGRQPKN